MLPVIAHNLLQSITLLATSCRALADRAIAGLIPNRAHMEELLERNAILVTALAPQIGYDRAAQIAKQAQSEGRRVRDVARELGVLRDQQIGRGARHPRHDRGRLPGRRGRWIAPAVARLSCSSVRLIGRRDG